MTTLSESELDAYLDQLLRPITHPTPKKTKVKPKCKCKCQCNKTLPDVQTIEFYNKTKTHKKKMYVVVF